MNATTLYRPPDVDAAYRDWKASCGPVSLAALLGRPVADVRELFPGWRGYANPTVMKSALTAAGVPWNGDYLSQWPNRGLAFLQVVGPWCDPGVPFAAAYRHTHWVAVKLLSDGTDSGESDEWVYDINAGAEDGTRGDWWPRVEWERAVMPAVVAGHRRATGWRVRLGIEVSR